MAKFCKNCGNPIVEGDVFCDNCGTPVNSNNAPQPKPVEPVQQTQPVQPVQNIQPVNNARKKSAVPIILAVVITLVVAAGAFAVYFFFFKDSGKNDKGKTEPTAATTVTTEATETTTEPETKTETETETETEAEPEPETEPETIGDPDPSDFKWTVGLISAPSGADILTDSEDVSGEWKVYLEYPTTEVKELATADIMAGDRAVTIEYRPFKIDYDGKGYRKSTDKTYELNGSIDAGTVYASNETRGTLTINEFYKLGSKYYAIGEMLNPSGEKAYAYLVR